MGWSKVLVRAAVLATKPTRCDSTRRLRGRVLPAQPSTKVALQRRTNGAWKTVASDVLDERSRFELKIPVCGSAYRIAWVSTSSLNESGFRYLKLPAARKS